uniref:Ig-like domain-containing protein n=1 Tax=Sinocyclocheilus anshuiensis TaxID=1608454 RepID=A0A671PJF4_9TELE
TIMSSSCNHTPAWKPFLFLFTIGVFGVKTEDVSVVEGDSVTLHTGTEKQKDDRLLWYFGPENSLIGQINGKVNSSMIYGGFNVRGKLDNQTGSLTITNISTTDSGLYNLKISTLLPVPVIIHYSSSECSKRSLLCSVLNVSHVTLSWYKGNSLISSIHASDFTISLSLPLEVEHQDKNTYRCVLNNNISNQIQHLDISELCQPSTSIVIFVFSTELTSVDHVFNNVVLNYAIILRLLVIDQN